MIEERWSLIVYTRHVVMNALPISMSLVMSNTPNLWLDRGQLKIVESFSKDGRTFKTFHRLLDGDSVAARDALEWRLFPPTQSSILFPLLNGKQGTSHADHGYPLHASKMTLF